MRLALVHGRRGGEEWDATLRVLQFFGWQESSLPQAREGSEWAKKLREKAEGHLVGEGFDLPLLLILDDDGNVVWACYQPDLDQLQQALAFVRS